MSKKSEISADDLALFLKAIAGTKKLASKPKQTLSPAASAQLPRRPHAKNPFAHPQEKIFFNETILEPVTGNGLIFYKKPGIAERTFKNLRKGALEIEDQLDLHGMTLIPAKNALKQFLEESLTAHLQIVCVIHGKGPAHSKPVLKNKLNHWLRDIPGILGFCSAPPRLGGSGALLILLGDTQHRPR